VNWRALILAVSAAAAWSLPATAQQSARPAVGFLQPGSPADSQHYAAAFQLGLKADGYVDGTSVTTEYRWAEGSYERLPQLVEDLVNRKVAVIAAGGPPATLAAKSATSTIPDRVHHR